MNDKINAMRATLTEKLQQLPALIKENIVLVAAGAAVLFAAIITIMLWSGDDPNMRPLFGRQERYDIATVIETLDAKQIPYTLHPDSGQILVTEQDLSKARLALAASGISPDMPEGMELLNNSGELGRSQFVEQARYTQGLEGELAKTIMNINSVRAARVHLAIPKRSSFLRETSEPTAAVFVDLYPGAHLKSEQVDAIVNLVAGSTPNLKPSNINVLDQNGNVLSGSSAEDLPSWQLEYTAKREAVLAQRITALLEPVVGPGNLRVQVTANMDYSAEQITTESFDKSSPVVRSESLASHDQNVQSGQGGIPGISSNRVADGGKSSTTPSSSSRTQRNYELDRTVTQSRKAPGTLEKLSIGILVNETAAKSGDGWSPEELEMMNNLVINAIGLDLARGDTISLYSLPFNTEPKPEELPPKEIWQELLEGEHRNAILIGGGVLLFILLALILRISLYRRQVKRNQLAIPQADKRTFIPSSAPPAEMDSSLLMGNANNAHSDKMIEKARQFAIRHPKQVAMMLEKWI